MRVFCLLPFFFAALFAPLAAHAELPGSPAAGLARIEFAEAISVAGLNKLLGHDANRFYVARADGSVKVVSVGRDKTATFILAAKAAKGEALLRRPEAAVGTADTIYVVDSELNHVAMYTADGKYQASFGRKGSDEGELRAPHGIAFHDGILYVADSGNGRIELFGDNGVFLETLGIDRVPANKAAKDKRLPYLLNKPTAITLDPAGRLIYVLDRDDSLFGGATAIKTYGPDGAFLGQLPQKGKFTAISAVADGLYAADEEGNAIRKYDRSGQLASAFVSRDNATGQFRSVDGLAADGGQVYAGDSARSAILDFRTNTPAASPLEPRQTAQPFVRWAGTVAASVSALAWNGRDTLYGIAKDGGAIIRIRNGVVEGLLKPKNKEISPVALDCDSSGALWVLDQTRLQVVRLDTSGSTLSAFGRAGSANGEFHNPTGIAVSGNGVIFVADAGNHRVQSFGDDGAFRGAIENCGSGKLKKPGAIALDPQGNLYVLDTDRASVCVYSATGVTLAEFGQDKADVNLNDPHTLMATRDEVFVGEPNRIKVYSHEGKYLRSFGAGGQKNGELAGVAAMTAKDATTVFIAEGSNGRIQSFTTIYKPAPPAQLTAEGKAHAIELRWTPSPLPYVAQYRVYRSRDATAGFVRISASKLNLFSDEGLPPDEPYFYRVAAESDAGYEGLPSAVVSGTPQKYIPPRPENVQTATSALHLKLSWNPLDSRFVSAYLVYRKDGDAYTKIGETVAPEFTLDGLTPGTEYTLYVTARSVDGIESERTVVHATTSAIQHKP